MDKLKWQRDRRKKDGNAYTKKYEKTPNGFLMRLYRNMKSRISGIQKHKAYLYAGKDLLPIEDFYSWAKPHPDFQRMFNRYIESGYDRKLVPTVDRIDPAYGYVIENMRWLTHSENSSIPGHKNKGRVRSEGERKRQSETRNANYRRWWYNEITKERIFLSCKEMKDKFGGTSWNQLNQGRFKRTRTGWVLSE